MLLMRCVVMRKEGVVGKEEEKSEVLLSGVEVREKCVHGMCGLNFGHLKVFWNVAL